MFCSFGAIVFELAAGHIMASPAMHESHLPSWTSPHIRVMLGSIFNAHGASGINRNCIEHRPVGVTISCLSAAHPNPPLPPLLSPSDMPTVDDLLILPFFAEKAEEIVPQGDRCACLLRCACGMRVMRDVGGSGRGLSLEGQQMLQNLMLESSNRFSRGAKKQPIKGMQHAFINFTRAHTHVTRAKAPLVRSCLSRTSSVLRRRQRQAK